jgi:hypothetical protein
MTPVLDGKGEGKENIQYRIQSKILMRLKFTCEGVQRHSTTVLHLHPVLKYTTLQYVWGGGGARCRRVMESLNTM